MTIYKIFKYLAVIIGVVSLFFAIRIIVAGEEAMKTSADLQSAILSPFMYITYVVLAISVILAVVFLLKDVFTGNIKETLYAVGGMVAIVIIAYLITEGQPQQMRDGSMLSASADHWIGTGLVIFYILGVAAIGSMLFGGVKKLIK